MKVTHPRERSFKERWIAQYCSKCIDYKEKNNHATAESLIFGQAGVWDFDICHRTCWRDPERPGNVIEKTRYAKMGLVKCTP